MRRFAFLAPLLAAGAHARPQAEKNNATSSVISSSSHSSPSAKLAPSSVVSSSVDSKLTSSSASRAVLVSSSSSASNSATGPEIRTTSVTPTNRTTVITPSIKVQSTTISTNGNNSTRSITPSPSPNASGCGCVLQATNLWTTSFNANDQTNQWTKVIVTETLVRNTTTYMDGSTVDTVVVNTQTLEQTKTVVISNGETVTATTPQMVLTPAAGMLLTVDAGPTYVIYNNLQGGNDIYDNLRNECYADQESLSRWEPMQTSDWSYFVQTYTSAAPSMQEPAALPAPAIQYLQNNLAIKSHFHGSNIATCSQRPTNLPKPPPVIGTETKTETGTAHAPERTTVPLYTSPAAFPGYPGTPVASYATRPYLSTSNVFTSDHVTVQGPLRRDSMSNQVDGPTGPAPPNGPGPGPTYSPINPPNRDQPPQNSPPGLPWTVGNTVVTVRPADPTKNPDNPNVNNQNPPGVVIGSNTLTAGQTTNINGVPVVVPVDGGGSRVIIGGTTVPVNPVPTGPPVLTVGQNTYTANPQGQIVVGSQTLQPGGPAITVQGSTLSLGPSGTIALVNGVTQTLGNAPVITPPPVLTVGGKVLTATTFGGSTQFLLNGQTLSPGSALTIDGTTYSMPSDGQGRTVVVNGATSTLGSGQSILTVGKQGITATVIGATTAFIFGPGQTLIPGGVLTVSGTTYSMPISASGSVIVINGVTSTLGQGPTTPAALTIDGKTYSATLRDGTTEYVLGQGTTLRPGQAITISGTTFSLDSAGTALVINGQTSTILRMPASNSASTTATSPRDVGNFVWSGIGGGGQSSSKGGAGSVHGGGLDKWVESLVIAAAGWLMTL